MKFGQHSIDSSQIFYQRKFVFAFTNLRPFLPGHVLLAPVRQEKKFANLTETEAMEMWISAKNIAEKFSLLLLPCRNIISHITLFNNIILFYLLYININ